MVFNSAVFLFYLIVVLAGYHLAGRFTSGRRIQNVFLLIASYYFYGYWDWIFLSLIFISTAVDYFVARSIEAQESERNRKLLLTVSMVVNLGLLGVFKYYDFFINSFVLATRAVVPTAFENGAGEYLLHLVLPVGISFYTFQTMSYTIDVYRRVIRAERDPIDFALFVCFFPQLVAGPIERAKDLLTQLKEERVVDLRKVEKGVWLLLLGFFMKVYVADNIGPLIDRIYLSSPVLYHSHPELASGHGMFHVLFASLAFVMQIYGDFAGYSFIAMGSAMLLGIKLTLNFNTPEFSENPADLWRRWHVTLGRWVMDYIYIPLGGNRYGFFHQQKNLFITFVLMGFWHGANWTFVFWGAYNGAWILIHAILKPYLPVLPENAGKFRVFLDSFVKRFSTFLLFGISAIFFRAYDLNHSMELFRSLFFGSWNLVAPVGNDGSAIAYLGSLVRVSFLLVILDYMMVRDGSVFWIFKKRAWVRALVYIILFFHIVIQGVFGKDVIYFAF